MPARTPEIDAGVRAVDAARAALDQAKTRLTKYVVNAPVAGRIEDTHYEMGEVATAGSPVLSLLPDDCAQADLLRAGSGASRPRDSAPRSPSPATDARKIFRREVSFLGSGGGVHAAGHLQPREPRQAHVPRRGKAFGRGGEACRSASRST